MPKLYLHPVTERVWHWIHALLVFLLILSGIQIHWPERIGIFGSFSNAISFHNGLGLLLVADFALWLAYNLISGRIAHYILKKEEIHPGMIVQTRFYLYDIFRNGPHPYPPSADNKFNPLQKASYCSIMFFLLPLLLISGVVYLHPAFFAPLVSLVGGLKVVALFHYGLAIFFAAFFVAHIYLATTGPTVLTNFTAMVTGYAEEEEH
jgi:thiosulfate reductase cytochrome b subunit